MDLSGYLNCPICGIGKISEFVEEECDRGVIVYSCDHELKILCLNDPVNSEESTKIESQSVDQIRGESIFQYSQKIAKGDYDRPKEYVSIKDSLSPTSDSM